jgi:cell division protein FtsW (lipid II flippase)
MRILFRKLGQVGWSFPIILALLALCIASVFAITSATYNNDALKGAPVQQIYFIIAGFVLYFAAALTPYQTARQNFTHSLRRWHLPARRLLHSRS